MAMFVVKSIVNQMIGQDYGSIITHQLLWWLVLVCPVIVPVALFSAASFV